MKRLSIFFAALLVSVGSIFAQEEVYKTISFAADNSTRGDKVQVYNKTWTSTTDGFSVSIANFNNNNWGWSYIKAGPKKNTNASATITTQKAIDKGITKVIVVVDQIANGSVTSATLDIASSATFSDVTTIKVDNEKLEAGNWVYTIPTPVKEQFYRLSFVCSNSTSYNGVVQISKIEYYANAAEIPATAIALDKETVTLDKGATEQLTATLTPVGATTAVVWTTENAAVATVEKGLVTAVGAGTTNIVATVTPAEGTTYTAKCAVTVVAAPDAPVFTVTDPVFEGSMQVAITAAEGMSIYYTTDGAEPTIESTKYEAPFAITATTTVKAIAYDATIAKASVVAEITYTKAMTCAEVNDATKGDIINLNTVTVVYVNGANTYVKDATGATLIRQYSLGLEAGQIVKGIKGTKDIFNGIPQIASVNTKDFTITDGTAPEPELQTTVPTMAEISKYIRLEGVVINEGTFTTSKSSQVTGTFAGTELIFYNTFKIAQEFEARKYNIIGVVTCYNETIEVAVISAEAIYNVVAAVNDDAMGAVTGAGEYEENTTATLTATANEGYKFLNWTIDEEIKTDNPLTLTVTDDITITANFVKDASTALENNAVEQTVVKTIENGQLIILRDGVRYNAQGQRIND